MNKFIVTAILYDKPDQFRYDDLVLYLFFDDTNVVIEDNVGCFQNIHNILYHMLSSGEIIEIGGKLRLG